MSTHSEKQDDAANSNGYKYWAFISYSHQDEDCAAWLHRALETYHIPRMLVGRKTSRGQVPRRLFPVFRDREELPGAADLSGRIKGALHQSRSLIVICSPKSAVSKWVNEEIKVFKSLGREDRVLCLILEGEPNASTKPESGLLECFPPAVRYRVGSDGELLDAQAEPVAADLRKGRDGRTNAKLKLLAGLLDVEYDELKQREKQRRLWQRLRLVGACVALLLVTMITYLAVADAGMTVPGGVLIRAFLDRHEASVLRPIHQDKEVRRSAQSLRRKLVEALHRGQTKSGWISASLKPGEKIYLEDVWGNSQTLSAVFSTSDITDQQRRDLVAALGLPFQSQLIIESNGTKYGWLKEAGEVSTQADPAIHTAMALAIALGNPNLLTGEERQRALRWLTYTQQAVSIYHPVETGGWNMFPNQKDPTLYNPYTTTVALLMLLETRRSGLSWQGSIERRDTLLRTTAQWLVDQYDAESEPPGWHGTGPTTAHATFDGLTLQTYAILLRAEAETGFSIPPVIINQIPRHLTQCIKRDLSFPTESSEFSAPFRTHAGLDFVGRDSVTFLWYPWAIAAAQAWLQRAAQKGASVEDHVQVRRALGHLVVDLGEDAVKEATADWAFVAAETLYGMSTIPPP